MPVWQWESGSGELWVEALPGSAHMTHCICRCALRSCGRWFPWAPSTLVQTDGTNRYIFIPLPLANPVSTDMLSVGWNNIFCSIHSKTFNYTWSRQLLLKRGSRTSADNFHPIPSVDLTLLDRIQRLIPLSSSCIILIALWAPLMQLSLLGAVTAHKMRITLQSD